MILKIDSFWSKLLHMGKYQQKKIVNTKTHKEGFLFAYEHIQCKPQDFNLVAEKRIFCITTISLSLVSIQCDEVVWETGYMDVIQQLFLRSTKHTSGIVSSTIL